jgi:hypothetical protein
VSTLGFRLGVSNGVDADFDSVVVTVLEDKTKMVWVSAGYGRDGAAGTREDPLAKIGDAITMAAGMGGDVYAANGSYPESITLQNGVSIYGGFSNDDQATWHRDDLSTLGTAIYGGAAAVTGQDASSLTLDGLAVHAAEGQAPGGSSIGIKLRN